jgi:hypothetical protein
VSTKVVQIKAQWSKLALPKGLLIFLIIMYVGKKILLRNLNNKSLDISHETSSSECLPSLSNKSRGFKIGLMGGGGVIEFIFLVSIFR